jgi:adenosine deaminase
MNKPRIALLAASLAIAYSGGALADSWGHHNSVENAVQQKINAVLNDPAALRSLLQTMPKGADLHSHTSGAVATEKLIQWGAEDGVCIDTTTFTAFFPCQTGQTPLSNALTDTAFYNQVRTAWSMEGYDGTLLEAHQHFFDAFGKFGAVLSEARGDDALADVLHTAGIHNQIYVELLQGFNSSTAASAVAKYFTAGHTWDEAYLLDMRSKIVADPTFIQTLNAQAAYIAQTLQGARALLGCGTDTPDPGCAVEVRYQVAANRTRVREYVYSQWVYAYELAQLVPQMVGINLVSPEENSNSLLYYDEEMFGVDVLRHYGAQDTARRQLHVSLHAGELIPEVLPATPEGQRHLTFHIRNAVDIAQAERIGHGVDVLSETAGAGVQDLLDTMRDKHVMVEVCLTSNATLLGAKGKTHPLRRYLANNVPVALATDDEGILRNDITTEYVAAAKVYKVHYKRLKDIVRTSLEHSFLPGASLWRAVDQFALPAKACKANDPLSTPSKGCAQFLAANEKAALQWKLEGQLLRFEQELLAP